MCEKPQNVAILILAAGMSKRFGEKPKQLIKIGNETLLNRSIRIAEASIAKDIFVVLGSSFNEIAQTLLQTCNVHIFENKNYESGIGSSIATGVDQLTKFGNYDAVCIILADLPLLQATHINQIIGAFDTTKNDLIVSRYSDSTTGPPTLLGAKYFQELKELKGDKGARTLIKRHKTKLRFIKLEDFNPIDIDTQDAYKRVQALIN